MLVAFADPAYLKLNFKLHARMRLDTLRLHLFYFAASMEILVAIDFISFFEAITLHVTYVSFVRLLNIHISKL